jgi:hypothetical protein
MYVYDIKIDNIRGDDDLVFGNDLRNWLKRREITYYFSLFKYTNSKGVVDSGSAILSTNNGNDC